MQYFKKSFKRACIKTTTLILALFYVTAPSFAAGTTEWVKVCQTNGKDKICNVIKDVVSDYGQPLAIFNIIEKGPRKIFQVTVPTGRHIPEGVSFQIGNGDVKKLDYAYCLGPSCVAQGDIDDKIINSMENSPKIKILSVNFQGASNPIETSLVGFRKAYASAGITEKQFIAQRSKIAQQAAKEEETAAQKLLDAQKRARNQ